MGEGTTRLIEGNGKAEPRSPREIERDIEHLRARLDRSLVELDRRRHELTDIRLQMRKHPAVFFGTSAALLLMVGGVGYAIYRSRQREDLPQKASRLRMALGRAIDKPQRVARSGPPPWQKILTAVGTTIAVSLAKKLVEQTFTQTTQPT